MPWLIATHCQSKQVWIDDKAAEELFGEGSKKEQHEQMENKAAQRRGAEMKNKAAQRHGTEMKNKAAWRGDREQGGAAQDRDHQGEEGAREDLRGVPETYCRLWILSNE